MTSKILITALSLALLQGCASQPQSQPVTVGTYLAAQTIKHNREYSAWVYCHQNGTTRTGNYEMGRQGSSPISIPTPRPGEYACEHIHTHPWEGYSHDTEPAPGPSPQDMQISKELPTIKFVVVDRFGYWAYQRGQPIAACPWNSNYSGVVCQ